MPLPLVRLGDCCDVVSGATPRTGVAEYWDGDIVWLTPKDIANLSDPVVVDSPDKITQTGFGSCSTQMLPTGAILVSSRAPIGHVAIAGRALCTNQGFKSLIPSAEVDSRYLYHCMKYFAQRLASLGNGATFKEVSKVIVEDFEIPLPQDVNEQRRIAAILDKADAIRKKRREALKLADYFLRSVYLTAVKSALHADASAISLLDIFRITTGKLDSNAAEGGGKYPFFTCAQETSRINTYAFDGEALLLAGNNASGDYSIKHYKGKFNAYQRTYVLSLKNERHSYGFFRYAVESKLRDLKRLSKGTNTKYLTLGILAEQMLVVPDEETQQYFAVAYQKVDYLKHSLKSHLAMANDLFSSLAHRAFSGQL